MFRRFAGNGLATAIVALTYSSCFSQADTMGNYAIVNLRICVAFSLHGVVHCAMLIFIDFHLIFLGMIPKLFPIDYTPFFLVVGNTFDVKLQ